MFVFVFVFVFVIGFVTVYFELGYSLQPAELWTGCKFLTFGKFQFEPVATCKVQRKTIFQTTAPAPLEGGLIGHVKSKPLGNGQILSIDVWVIKMIIPVFHRKLIWPPISPPLAPLLAQSNRISTNCMKCNFLMSFRPGPKCCKFWLFSLCS